MYRIGHGYDAHRLVKGEKLILGGTEIPYEYGLTGHSDADVLTHAVIDAVFGALADGDIGTHFPDTEEEYRGIRSIELLEKTGRLMRERGYRLVNLDTTVVAQKPKLALYIEAMRCNLGAALETGTDQVSVKATTEESMGFTGRREGISAHAVVLLEKYIGEI